MKNNKQAVRKFSREDGVYLSERKLVAEKLDLKNLFDIADHYGLYSGIQTIAKGLAVYELIKQTQTVPGSIFEFGCWKGSNLLLMAKIVALLQPNTIKEVYGFDSFEGLKTISKEDNVDKNVIGRYQGNEETLRKFIGLYGLEEWVHLIKGDATKTIKKFEESNPHILISLAYIDFDLFLPTKEALQFVHKRLSTGGLIVLDEAMTHEWRGEGKAMLDFLREHEGKYETSIIPFVRQPTVILKRRC
jgi:hypothetical protein